MSLGKYGESIPRLVSATLLKARRSMVKGEMML